MARFVLWIFEIGYLFQHIATGFQILKILKKQNSEMVSLETNVLFLIGAITRIGWMWDSMLKSFYISYIEILLAIGTLGYVIYLYEVYKVRNYYSNEIKMPIYLQLYVLIPLAFILAFLFHPGSSWFSSQIFVSMSIFSEAFGLIPQLYMVRKSKDTGDISELYIVFLGIARLFRLVFWIKMYIDGMRYFSLIVADLIHFLCLFNFIYNAIMNFSGHGLPFSEKDTKKMF